MEIIGKSGERRTVYLALLSLACIGAVLAVLTWQLVRQQEKAEREHLELTAKAVLQAVHSSFARAHRMMAPASFSKSWKKAAIFCLWALSIQQASP